VNSPTNRTVVTVVDKIPNRVKSKHPAGNHIVIHRRGTEFVILGQLSPHTTQVTVGHKVKMGDPVTECGSSGQATASHVHVHMQTTKEPLGFTATALPMIFTRTGIITKKGCKSKSFYILKTKNIHCSPTRFQ
jgi:murein DD-endopeptidase MepM/ murein hydrolase activator NlpD